jgi:hypothetical protein
MSNGSQHRAIVVLALTGSLATGCYGASRQPYDDAGPTPGTAPDAAPWVDPDGGPWVDPDGGPWVDPDGGPWVDPDGGWTPGDAGPIACSTGMVQVPGLLVCIDRYEASRGARDVPRSVAGELPWVHVTWREASAACELAGKRLCTAREWVTACRGPEGLSFPYGDFYDAGRCNDETSSAGSAVPTGHHETCEGGVEGLFDMSGNVEEWLLTPSINDGDGGLYYEPVGGSYQDIAGCEWRTGSGSSPTSVRSAATGFRCCLAP